MSGQISIITLLIYLIICAIFSKYLTQFFRNYALNNSLIDIPNQRSSHSIPTPRGGGISIVIPVLFIILPLFYLFEFDKGTAIALGAGGLSVAIIGWMDDHKHIAAERRAIAYLIISMGSVYFLHGVESTGTGTALATPHLLLAILSVFWIAWMINLYNFMDGADAFLIIQTISTALFMGVLLWVGGQVADSVICLTIAASSFGFLYWNFPPAKIFMGDVGSCFLGICFGILMVAQNSIPFAIWLILLVVFICDATFTLLMRIVRREKWYEAHRSHAYQRLIQLGISHKKLSISLLIFNMFVLWPLAWLGYREQELIFYILFFVFALVAVIWVGIQLKYYRLDIIEN